MSGGFVKLYASVLTSSIWAETPITKLCWIALLILADADGRIEGTVPGLARLIGVSVPDFEAALAVFTSPDPYSRSKVADGRRMIEIEGGWRLVNHAAYREKRSQKQVRQAEWLASKRASARRTGEPTRVDMSTNVDHVDAQKSEIRDQRSDGRSPLSPPCSDPADANPGATAKAPSDDGDPGSAQSVSKAPEPEAEKPTRRARRARLAETPIPPDWAPTEAHVAYAAKHGLDLDHEAEAFRGWSDGRSQVSWNGRFATWLANEAKWKRQRGAAAPKRRFGSAQRDHGVDPFSFHRSNES